MLLSNAVGDAVARAAAGHRVMVCCLVVCVWGCARFVGGELPLQQVEFYRQRVGQKYRCEAGGGWVGVARVWFGGERRVTRARAGWRGI